MGGLSGQPESCPGAVEVEDVSPMIGLFRSGAGGNSGAPRDDGASPAHCGVGTI